MQAALDILIILSTSSPRASWLTKCISRIIWFWTAIRNKIKRAFMLTHASFSHNCPFWDRMNVGAESHGLDCLPMSEFNLDNKVIAVFKPIGPPVDESFLKLIKPKEGDHLPGYDYGAAGSVALRSTFPGVWRRVGSELKNNLADPKRMMCTEYITAPLHHAGYKSVRTSDVQTTSAYDLLFTFLKNSQEFKLMYIHPDAAVALGIDTSLL